MVWLLWLNACYFMVIASSSSTAISNWKDILHYVFDSGELKIKSEQSIRIKETIKELCANESQSFQNCFTEV